jgi:hypothetical protein
MVGLKMPYILETNIRQSDPKTTTKRYLFDEPLHTASR